ncbi:hypothetical protein [Endozoicomonas sp.]|uniref:hypothetical protein n=1 Tax=Endozoicomonas sp. TaxID=1892382 RepID=UPI00383AF330
MHVIKRPYLPHDDSTLTGIKQSGLLLQSTSKACDQGSHTSRIGHRKTQSIPAGQSLYSFKTIAENQKTPDQSKTNSSELDACLSTKIKKEKNDLTAPASGSAAIEKDISPEPAWYTVTEGYSSHSHEDKAATASSGPTLPYDYKDKSHTPLVSNQTGTASYLIDSADAWWHPVETFIQSGIEEPASTPIADSIPVSEGISDDTLACDEEPGDEALESNPDHLFPIDVDAIDSDLNTQGFDPGNASSEEISTASCESGEDYFTPSDEPQGKRYVDDRKQDTPLLFEDIYGTSMPVCRLSPDAYGYPSGIKLDREDDVPELLISLYPHGILQALLLVHPATTINIIECRLRMLTVDAPGPEVLYEIFNSVKSDWQNGLQNRNHQLALLRDLRAYEHEHNLYSLESKLDADFLVHKGRISSKILATPPEESESNKFKDPQLWKPWTWLRGIGVGCKKREDMLRGAIRHLAGIKLERSRQRLEAVLKKRPLVRLPDTGEGFNKQDIFNQYIQEQPDTIKRLLTSLVCFTAKCDRNLRTIKAAKFVLATGQQKKTPQSIRTLIEQFIRSNLLPEIANHLKEAIYGLHCTRLEHELESSKCDAAGLPTLLETRRQIINVESLDNPITTPLSDGEPGILQVRGNQISAQLIHLFLETQSCQKESCQKESPQKETVFYPSWYVLKPPSCLQIESILKQPQDSPEKSFYQATLRFIDALSDFKSDDPYENVLRWMQCYYDVAYYEQKLFIHLIESSEPHPLLPFESFEQNIEALGQLAKARKEIGYRALNPDSYAYYLSYANIVWQEDDSIEDIIAELYRKEYLKRLKYEPCTEFKALFCDVVNQGSKVARSAYIKTEKLLQRLKDSGLSDSLNFLYQEGKGLIASLFSPENPIHTFITDTLSTILEVAQQSPRFFRVMWGDFALLMPQLESLLGKEASITGPLQRIATCMHGQALASLFSGDRPHKLALDFDPDNNPRLATFIKRFQLLRDIITALHIGLPVMEIFLCRNSGQLESRLKKIAWNSLSTYLARQCVSHIKPPLIRLCNSLRYARDLMPGLTLGLTSGFLASINAEDSVRLAHHIGRRSGIYGGALSFALDPFIMRFDKYREKVEKVKADTLNAEAHIELQSERKKVAGIFGISSVFSTIAVLFINTFKIIVFIGSPFITTAVVGLSTFFFSGLYITRRFNKFDEVATTLTEAIKTHLKKIFSKDSSKAIEARQRAHKISKSVLEKMSDIRGQEHRGWKIWKSNSFRLELRKYWNQLQNKEKELQRIKETIRKNFYHHLQQDAHHVHNFVNVRKLIENSMKDPDRISSNPNLLADFNRQLTSLHFSPLDASVFAYQLMNLKQEIDAFLLHYCNTTSPGDDIDTIMDTLETYNIELYKGDYILNMLHMRSTSLNTNRSKSNHLQNSSTPDGQTDKSQPYTWLPNVDEAQAILEKVTRKCYEQQLEKEEQLREERMEMVTERAIHESLKHEQHASVRSFPDIPTPLLESHLELQIRAVEKAGLPWFVDEKCKDHQQWDTDKPASGSTYRAAEACARISAACSGG